MMSHQLAYAFRNSLIASRSVVRLALCDAILKATHAATIAVTSGKRGPDAYSRAETKYCVYKINPAYSVAQNHL